jgi:hypothetical protein
MRGPVDPVTARKGTYIESFGIGEFAQMEGYAVHLEMAAEQNGIKGEFVYTRIPKWGKKSKHDTWQIFLMPEGWDDDGSETLP